MSPTRCRPLLRNQKPQELGNPVGVSAVTILGKESEAQGTRDLTLNRPTGTGGPSWVLSLSFPVEKSSSPFLLLAMRGIRGGAGVQGSWGQGRGKGWGTGVRAFITKEAPDTERRLCSALCKCVRGVAVAETPGLGTLHPVTHTWKLGFREGMRLASGHPAEWGRWDPRTPGAGRHARLGAAGTDHGAGFLVPPAGLGSPLRPGRAGRLAQRRGRAPPAPRAPRAPAHLAYLVFWKSRSRGANIAAVPSASGRGAGDANLAARGGRPGAGRSR